MQKTQETGGSILGQEEHGNPIPIFLPGRSRGQRSLEGYSTQGHKESDTTENKQVKLI